MDLFHPVEVQWVVEQISSSELSYFRLVSFLEANVAYCISWNDGTVYRRGVRAIAFHACHHVGGEAMAVFTSHAVLYTEVVLDGHEIQVMSVTDILQWLNAVHAYFEPATVMVPTGPCLTELFKISETVGATPFYHHFFMEW